MTIAKPCVCSPTSDGGACAILASEEFVIKHNLQAQAVEIIAQQMATDFPSTFNEKSATKVVSLTVCARLTYCQGYE